MLRSEDKIGPYTLIRKLGKGGFGEVWLVEEHEAILSSQFALKILFDEDADLDAVKQEASVWLHASGHPNVLPIHKAAVYDGQFVIVSEYAPDGSLKDWLKQHSGKAPSIKEAIRITDSILAGLGHLHARRIIHRDIKPDNVLMQGSTPRLTDFGISRILQSTVHSKILAGTPQYMAPEAFRGERDEQTDIWAVGVMLYQIVGGRLPFPETDVYALMNQVANTEPLLLGADVPEPLQRVITKALEKAQANRYESASLMRGALQEAQRQIEEQKKQPAVGRDAEATIIREPKPVKFDQQKPTRIEYPKPPSIIPREPQARSVVKSKRLLLQIGGVVLVVMIVLAVVIFNNKSKITNSSPPDERPKAQIYPSRNPEVNNTKVKTRGAVTNISDESLEDLSVEVYLDRGEGTKIEVRRIPVKPNVLVPRQQGLYEFEYEGGKPTGFSRYKVIKLLSKNGEVKFTTPSQ
jgi:serine/threonine protein kinase